MTLQQLRYLIAIASHGSISAAAHTLYVSQSSLSVAVRDIERETGVTIFERSNRGITLTSDGVELLGYARQVVEQADLMAQRYSGRGDGGNQAQRLAITSQHYAFVVEAFLELAEEYEEDAYNFSLRETRTAEVIEDVRDFRSDLGVLYLSSFNESVIGHALDDANLSFNLLFSAQPHIFVSASHPLAERTEVTLDDLAAWPRYAFEQGNANSFFWHTMMATPSQPACCRARCTRALPAFLWPPRSSCAWATSCITNASCLIWPNATSRS